MEIIILIIINLFLIYLIYLMQSNSNIENFENPSLTNVDRLISFFNNFDVSANWVNGATRPTTITTTGTLTIDRLDIHSSIGNSYTYGYNNFDTIYNQYSR